MSSTYDFPRLFAIKIRKKSYKFQTSICIRITSSLHLRHLAYILKVWGGGDLSKILIRSKPNPSDLFILIQKGGYMWATPSKFKLYVSLRICLLREKDVPAKPHPHATCLNFDFNPCIIGKLI